MITKTERARAGIAVLRAVRDGILPRLDGSVKCIDCGAVATDYDHRDYLKPLEVEPVCRSCNLYRGPAKDWVPVRIRDCFSIHVRIHPEAYEVLKKLADIDGRNVTNMAAYLLHSAILAQSLKQGDKDHVR